MVHITVMSCCSNSCCQTSFCQTAGDFCFPVHHVTPRVCKSTELLRHKTPNFRLSHRTINLLVGKMNTVPESCKYKKLSCCRESACCFVSLNILLKSLKIIRNDVHTASFSNACRETADIWPLTDQTSVL